MTHDNTTKGNIKPGYGIYTGGFKETSELIDEATIAIKYYIEQKEQSFKDDIVTISSTPGELEDLAKAKVKHLETSISNLPSESKDLIDEFSKAVTAIDTKLDTLKSGAMKEFDTTLVELNEALEKLKAEKQNAVETEIKAVDIEIEVQKLLERRIFLKKVMESPSGLGNVSGLRFIAMDLLIRANVLQGKNLSRVVAPLEG